MNNCWSIGLQDSTNYKNQKTNDIYYQEWLVVPPALWLKNDRCKHEEGKKTAMVKFGKDDKKG